MSRPAFDPDALIAAALGGGGPVRDLGLRIDRDGAWSYKGSPIRRPELVRLFAGILRRGPDGNHWLVTPAELGRIEVEDAAFTIVELRQAGSADLPLLELRTNLGTWIALDAAHPMRLAPMVAGVSVPYVQVRDGLEARVTRPVFYELVDLALPEGEGDVVGVRSGGLFFPLGEVPAESGDRGQADGGG